MFPIFIHIWLIVHFKFIISIKSHKLPGICKDTHLFSFSCVYYLSFYTVRFSHRSFWEDLEVCGLPNFYNYESLFTKGHVYQVCSKLGNMGSLIRAIIYYLSKSTSKHVLMTFSNPPHGCKMKFIYCIRRTMRNESVRHAQCVLAASNYPTTICVRSRPLLILYDIFVIVGARLGTNSKGLSIEFFSTFKKLIVFITYFCQTETTKWLKVGTIQADGSISRF